MTLASTQRALRLARMRATRHPVFQLQQAAYGITQTATLCYLMRITSLARPGNAKRTQVRRTFFTTRNLYTTMLAKPATIALVGLIAF